MLKNWNNISAKHTRLWRDQKLNGFKRVRKENQHERSEGETRRKGVKCLSFFSKKDVFNPRQVPERMWPLKITKGAGDKVSVWWGQRTSRRGPGRSKQGWGR